MLILKTATVKNFLSIGNQTQAVNFDRNDLTLVLGENLDLGGDDQGSRNGTGKTTLVNALSYGLFGQALTKIKRDNLINHINGKNMLVTIEFEKDGTLYKIERGRKPTIFKFFVNNQEFKDSESEGGDNNDSQGESKETQHEINKLLGMSHDMFKNIVALNTNTIPFLSMKADEQRSIIEQLLGITQLSEKAEALKEQIRMVKEAITTEEIKIKAILESNQRISEQVEGAKRRQTIWLSRHQDDVEKLSTTLEELLSINIEDEIDAHHRRDEISKTTVMVNSLTAEIVNLTRQKQREEASLAKASKDLEATANHTCYACGQELHDEAHEKILSSKNKAVLEHQDHLNKFLTEIATREELLKELKSFNLELPTVHYASLIEANNHKNQVESLQEQLIRKYEEEDPYADQIVEMQNAALQKVDYDPINQYVRLKEHQEFLLKLLVNKDSFIRKKIIDQNLSFLNSRLGYYLSKIGLPHTVVFQNDLSVEITLLGMELDFDNLSRGEKNRLILSLCWSFRDVWENLYQSINLLFIDELIDNGMDPRGVEDCLAILKKFTRERNKAIFLISHKDELSSRVNNIMKVVKENGFTTYDTSGDDNED